jgi:hypothetical protein
MASAVVSGPSAFYTTPDHAAAARNILPQPCAHSPSLSASLFRAEDWAAEIKLLDGGVGELEDELYDTQLGARIVSYAYEPDLAFTAVAWLGQQRRDFQHNLHHAARVVRAARRARQRTPSRARRGLRKHSANPAATLRSLALRRMSRIWT